MDKLNTVDLEHIKMRLYEKLKSSGWADKLKTFILSEDFTKILIALLKDAQEGKRFTPPMKQVFRAFEECPFKDLKVVIMAQDPYPYLNIADGIALSCGNTDKLEPALKFVFKELEATVYPDGYKWDQDLKRWSNQGVLMLNTALTTTIGKPGQHYLIWQPFIAFVMDLLMYSNPGLIYVYVGKKAQEWADGTPDNNYKIFCSHPITAINNDPEHWNSDDVFNKVNKILKDNNNQMITW